MFLHDNQNPVLPATAPPDAEELELALAISASIQSAMQENPPLVNANMSSEASSSNTQSSSLDTRSSDLSASKVPAPLASIELPVHGPSSSGSSTEHSQIQNDSDVPVIDRPDLTESAPPISEDGPILYPSIDSSPIDISSPTAENVPAKGDDKKDQGDSSSCVICLDAPVEGACIPCGHMAGCMSCLNEIKAKKWGCPVCRAKIDQVIKLYAVV